MVGLQISLRQAGRHRESTGLGHPRCARCIKNRQRPHAQHHTHYGTGAGLQVYFAKALQFTPRANACCPAFSRSQPASVASTVAMLANKADITMPSKPHSLRSTCLTGRRWLARPAGGRGHGRAGAARRLAGVAAGAGGAGRGQQCPAWACALSLEKYGKKRLLRIWSMHFQLQNM